MGATRIADLLPAMRALRPGWLPSWTLAVRTEHLTEETPLNELLITAGFGSVVDWSLLNRTGIRGIESVLVTDEHGSPRWDQPAFIPRRSREQGAVIVPWFWRDAELHVGLQREYRPLVMLGDVRGCDLWAFPRGNATPGESPAETAARELREETSLEPISAQRIGSVVSDTAWVPDGASVFAAEVAPRSSTIEFDGSHEGVRQLVFQPLEQVLARDDVVCGFTLSALALYVGFALRLGWRPHSPGAR